MENLLFLGVPILKHIRVNGVSSRNPYYSLLGILYLAIRQGLCKFVLCNLANI